MELTSLTAISPIDGRYHQKTQTLQPIFSEYGLMQHRIVVEVRWLQALAKHPAIEEVPTIHLHASHLLDHIHENFSLQDAERIKNIEKTTNHDVKAIEYFIKEKIASNKELQPVMEFIHFGCTSEDINNLAYGLMLKAARSQILLPQLDDIIQLLSQYAQQYANTAMLAHTHGQPASPTTLGKEFANVVYRLKRQRQHISNVLICGKINGAVGNFNAHSIAYPDIDWPAFSQQFVEDLGLHNNPMTTQIEPHDYIAELAHAICRTNTILIDLARDMWGYISKHYFSQTVSAQEVGSSTMPHKVNPIDFENAEGNLALANALFNHMATTLPTSRWQRDLTDSTLLRNLGSAFAYTSIAYQALLKGINKCQANQEVIQADLAQHWEVLAEALQTVMRRHGIEKPYEQLKAFSRGKTLDQNHIRQFIEQSELPTSVKQMLHQLTPDRYTGLSAQLVNAMLKYRS